MRFEKIKGYYIGCLLLLMAVAVYSCKKNYDVPSTSSTLTTKLNVISATTDTLNFYLNGSRVNSISSIYPFGNTGYLDVKYGDQTYQFKPYRSSAVLFDLPLSLDTGQVYSLFIAGRQAKDTFMSLDTLTSDTANRAMLRFVNASPDSVNLDVSIGDTLKFTVRPYKSISAFIPVGSGLKHIKVLKAGTTTAISDTTRTLLANTVYTLFAKGTLAGTGGGKFGTGMLVNK
ncbi:hypothetical protein A0256_11445 [Mucilaginibacter sp. PAMC 26640]|nr:hypothetical protein A0256_11445 [Mucilaginibacter sp. PAMC 26640]